MVPQLTAKQRDIVIIAVCVTLHLIMIAFSAVRNDGFGLPLDDSWIFQTYARNLAETGQWAFVPGQPSTGSTSVLWTPLLVPGHLLPLNPVIWAYVVGLLAYTLTVLGAARLLPNPTDQRLPLLAGLAVSLEWHLIWASGTGMDTPLMACLVMWFWVWVLRHDPAEVDFSWRNGALLGLFGGVLMLARPEGLLALAVAGLWGLSRPGAIPKRLLWGAAAGAGFALILVPLITWNISIAGDPWPSTFYAKQAEYAILWERPLPLRFAEQLVGVATGPLLIVLPGVVIHAVNALRQRQFITLLPLVWVLLHWLAYAFRLPVIYQNARYAIPTIPILVVLGVAGLLQAVRPNARQASRRLLSRLWLTFAVLGFAGSALVWAPSFHGRNVSFINNDMVTTARWLAEHRQPGDLVAAHDIGALGYFAPGPLLDMAGLISPEVVPFITDPDRLAEFVVSNEADYMVVFPGWSSAYTQLVADPRFCEVYAASDAPGYEAASEEIGPMTVYRVTPDGDCTP